MIYLRIMMFTLVLSSTSYAQRYENNLIFRPPIGARHSSDFSRWGETKCDTTIVTPDTRTHYFDHTLSRSRLEKTAKWNPLKERPKVSAEDAARIAVKKMETTRPLGDGDYQIAEIRLQVYWDRWLWVVVFSPKLEAENVSDMRFPIFVLMDGTTVDSVDTTPSYLVK